MVIGRTENDLHSVCDEIGRVGGQAVPFVGDVADPGTSTGAVALALSNGWRIGHVVCNAGIGKGGSTELFDVNEWSRIFDVNVHGAFYLIRAALPEMLASGSGVITIISSIAGLVGVPFDAAYTSSKHALVGLARSLDLEYRKRGISVAALCPSFVESEMTARTVRSVMRRKNFSEVQARNRISENCPGGRILDPDEIARTVCCLGNKEIHQAHQMAASGGYQIIPEQD